MYCYECCCPRGKSLSSRTNFQVLVLGAQVLVLVLELQVLVLVLGSSSPVDVLWKRKEERAEVETMRSSGSRQTLNITTGPHSIADSVVVLEESPCPRGPIFKSLSLSLSLKLDSLSLSSSLSLKSLTTTVTVIVILMSWQSKPYGLAHFSDEWMCSCCRHIIAHYLE